MTEIIERPMTPEEEAERAAWAIQIAEQKKIDLAKNAAKESALKKLAKLGLTEAEAKAVIGID